MILVVLLLIFLIILLVDVFLIILWVVNFKETNDSSTTTPMVTILIAARNEENNIGRCLDAIMAVDYPEDKLEVLVGDDMSEDKTAEVLEAYEIRYKPISYISIFKKTIAGNGKANVLAQLASKAKGEVLFITDADISVPPNWIKSMLKGMRDDVALVTGTSVVVGQSFLAYMQQIDWLYATGMLKVVSDLNIPVTTMGNNMALRKSAYQQVGGYEAMPFSVTEDLELFNHIKKRYKTVNLFNSDVLNTSSPQRSFSDLLKQRKRWMRGAFQLPLIMIVLLILQSSYLAFILGILIINPMLGLLAIILKFCFRYIFLSMVVKRLKSSVNIFGSLIFEFYSAFFSLVSLFYYLMPGKIEWKGREYE